MHIQHIPLHTTTSDLCGYYAASSISRMISITVIDSYFVMISPIATFVFIPIIDGDDLAFHMFTPAIGTDLGLIVNASEYSHILKV